MNHILIPAKNRSALGMAIRQALRGKLISNSLIAGRAGLSTTTVESLTAGYGNRAENIRLATLVGLADAIGTDPMIFVEAVNPGRNEDVGRAAIEYARNMVRPTITPIIAAVVDAVAPKPAVPIVVPLPPVAVKPERPGVPTALDLMLQIKRLSEEDRLLVAEFIQDVTAVA